MNAAKHTGSNNQGINWCYRPRRDAIKARDGHSCRYCLAPAGGLDHLLGRRGAGCNESGALVVACAQCNAAKGSLSLAGFAAYLRARGISVADAMARVAAAVATPVSVGRPTRPSTVRAVRRAIAQAVVA